MDAVHQDLEAIRRALFSGQKSRIKAQAQAAFLRLTELVERGVAVGVLDEWVKGRRHRGYMISDTGCAIYGTPENPKFLGTTPDEAREAAAKAIDAGEM